MIRTKRIVTDGTDSAVFGANALTGMATRPFVVMTDDAVTVRAVSNEVSTVRILALDARLCVRVTEDSVVVRTSGLVGRTEGLSTGDTGLDVFRAEVFLTRVTRLSVLITGDSLADVALYSVGFADIVTAGSTRFEMVSAERVVTQVTVVGVSRANEAVTLRTNLGVVSTDDIFTDATLTAVSLTDFLTAGFTRCQVVGAEGVRTDFTFAGVCGTQRVTTTGAVDSVVHTDRVPAGSTGRGVRCTHTAVTGGTRGEVGTPELARADLALLDCFGAVVSATSVTGDGVVVATNIPARFTGHSIVGAKFDVTGGTGFEMGLTDRVRTLVTGAGMGVAV